MKKRLLIELILVLGLLALSACGADYAIEDEVLDDRIVIAGSTSMQPLSEELAAVFTAKNPGISIEVLGGGSGVGIKAAKEGIAGFGAASRELKPDEKSGITAEYVIAYDGIAVIVNPLNQIGNLTIEEIRNIFTGEITNWKDVGGADEEIKVVSREEGSGTRGTFIAAVGISQKDESGIAFDMTTKKTLIQPSTGAVIQTVANTPNTIGYVSIGSLNDMVKVLKIDGIRATNKNIIEGTYKISRPFLYLTHEDLSPGAKAYLDFVLGEEGQSIIAKNYIPMIGDR